MAHPTVRIQGKRYVLLEECEWRSLQRMATVAGGLLPPLPPADAQGNRPAAAYVQVSIARDIIRRRNALGLSRERLAALARVRQATLARLESGQCAPNVPAVAKIERALAAAVANKRTAGKSGRRRSSGKARS